MRVWRQGDGRVKLSKGFSHKRQWAVLQRACFQRPLMCPALRSSLRQARSGSSFRARIQSSGTS
eukprot:6433216-Karenia_brevis.AAC.1